MDLQIYDIHGKQIKLGDTVKILGDCEIRPAYSIFTDEHPDIRKRVPKKTQLDLKVGYIEYLPCAFYVRVEDIFGMISYFELDNFVKANSKDTILEVMTDED